MPLSLEPVQTMLGWIELIGLLAFAASGYLEAERRQMDPVGHFALAFITAFGGGTLRDLLIDRRPLFWVEHQEWVLVILLLCLTLPWITRLRPIREQSKLLLWSDALGMGLFAVSGTAFALQAGMPVLIAAMMGVITATLGGVMRDMVCNEVPRVFQRTELYATCAFAGAWLFIGLSALGVAQPLAMAAGTSVAFFLRVAALTRHWTLPRVRPK
ncbi:MAG: trimeric intracellular cation channel family protein [Burkholderiaceae bacterium]